MRDSALKPAASCFRSMTTSSVGEELMRDSALKPSSSATGKRRSTMVGEELMRDSALKPARLAFSSLPAGRRRAHARQRFETRC